MPYPCLDGDVQRILALVEAISITVSLLSLRFSFILTANNGSRGLSSAVGGAAVSSEGFAARGAASSEGAGSSGEAALHEGAGAAWADAAGGDVEPVTGISAWHRSCLFISLGRHAVILRSYIFFFM